jgi:hypothetical protein
MFPTFVLVHAQIDLHEGTPFRTLGFADKVHAGFLRSVIGLAGVAGNAGANDIFPSRGATAIAWNDVVEIQILAIKNLAAILARAVVALKNIMPRELDFLLGQPIKHDEQDDPGHADFEGDGVDAFRVRLLLGQILPLIEAKRLKGAIVTAEDSLGVPFKEQGEGAARGADIDRLPQSV